MKRYVTEGGGTPSGDLSIGIELGGGDPQYNAGTFLNVTSSANKGDKILVRIKKFSVTNKWNSNQTVAFPSSTTCTVFFKTGDNNNNYPVSDSCNLISETDDDFTISLTIPNNNFMDGDKQIVISIPIDGNYVEEFSRQLGNSSINFSSDGGTPVSDSWEGTSRAYPSGGSWVTEGSDTYWKADFGTVQLTNDGKTYTYYIEESNVPEGCTVTYNVNGTESSNASENRLSDSGTITITNTLPPTTEIEVNKVWSDGNTSHSSDTATVELYKVRTEITPEPENFHLTVQIPETSYRPTTGGNVTVSLYGPKNGQEGQWIEDIVIPGNGVWTATSSTELSPDGNYTLSISDNAASTTNTYWDSDVYAAKPTLSETSISSGNPKIVNVLTQAKSSEGGEGNVTVVNWGSSVPQNGWAQIKINNIFWATGSPSEGFSYTGQSGKEQELTHHWRGDTSKDVDSATISPDAQYDSSSYQYMRFNLQLQEFQGPVYITCVGGKAYKETDRSEITSSTGLTNGGVIIEKSVTEITISLVAPNTSNRSNRILTLLRAPALTAASPATYNSTGYNDVPTGQTGLNVPAGAIKVDEQVLNNGSNTWNYKWTALPTTETEGGKTYSLTYYVKESLVHSGADSVSSSYTYVYNTAGDSRTGVKLAIITNTPTYSGGLKIVKTFDGIPINEAEVDLTQTEPYKNLSFTITNPDKTERTPITLGQFTRVETTDEDGIVHYSYEYVVAETGLTIGDVYSVTETNSTDLITDYTITSESVTSGSSLVPRHDMGVISLYNNYEPIKGSITVTKNIFLNGEVAPDDVAPGQRFRIGLEYRPAGSTSLDSWTIVTNDDGTPRIATLIMGSGSTVSVTFDNLLLGQYRAFEIPDSITNTDSLTASDIYSAISDGTITINSVEWKVSSTGVYYDYNHGESETRIEHDVSDESGTEDVVVISSDEGGYGDVAPRHADITIKNNKIEKGKITVNKTLLYNGEPDIDTSWYKVLAEKLHLNELTDRKVKVGLYSDANATTPVNEPGTEAPWVQEIDISTSTATGSVIFNNLDFGTYYVFELDDDGNPVKDATGEFFHLTYTVAADNGAQIVSHNNREVDLSFTNSYKEYGKITVTKKVNFSGSALSNSAMGERFDVGLFTKDGEEYKLVPGKYGTVTIGKDNQGTLEFNNLEFAQAGTTYYVFEIDKNRNPIHQNGRLNGYTVTSADQNVELSPSNQERTAEIVNHDSRITVEKRWMSNGTVWNFNYNGGTIYFKLYKEKVNTDNTVTREPVSEEIYSVSSSDYEWVPASALGEIKFNDVGSKTDGKIVSDNAENKTEDNVTYYKVPYMMTITGLPDLESGWSYIAVETMENGTPLNAGTDANDQYWTCMEFNGGAFALKNDLEDVTATKNWQDPQDGKTYYHPAVTFKLYRTEVAITSNDTDQTIKSAINAIKQEKEDTHTVDLNRTGYTFTELESKTLAAGTTKLTVTWDNLPQYNLTNGKRYVYVVVEEAPASGTGYVYNGYTVNDNSWTYSNKLDSFNLYVKKQWQDKDGNNITDKTSNPNSVEFELYRQAYSDANRTAKVQVDGADKAAEMIGTSYQIEATENKDGEGKSLGTYGWQKVINDMPRAAYTADGLIYYGYYVVEKTTGYTTTYQVENGGNAVSTPSDAVLKPGTTGDGALIIINKKMGTDLKVLKVARGTTTSLPNAEFRLDQYATNTYTEVTKTGTVQKTGADGTLELKDLGTGYYKLVEVNPPEGYVKTADDPTFEIYLDSDGTLKVRFTNTNMVSYDSATKTFTVQNELGKELPSTGGIGTTMFYVFGALLVAGSVSVLIARRRRRA